MTEADKPSVEGLLPCPFCGGEAAFVPRAVNLALQKDPSDPKFGVSVICGTCSAETGNFIDETAASLRWNRRPSNRSVEGLMELVQDHGDYCRDELPEAAARELTAIRAYAEALASAAAPAAQPAPTVFEVANKTSSALFASREEAQTYLGSFTAATGGGLHIVERPVFGAAQPATPLREVLSDLERVRKSLHEANEVGLIGDVLWAGPAETTFDALDGAIAALRSRLDGEKT